MGPLCSQASDLCILWSPNLHTWLQVKQALRTSSIQMFEESDWYFCNSIEFLFMFVNPHDKSICMSMCLSTTAHSGPSFAHFFRLTLKFCWVPRCHLFVASAGITMASPLCPCALQALSQQSGCAWRAASSAAGSHPSEEAASKARGCACSFFQHSKAVPLQVLRSRSSEGGSLFLP